MHALIEKAIKIADSKYTVLIRGDTGTGKELLARAIHNSGQRRFYPFIPVNCSALPESLMESEFFGYEKGAFSGADCKGKKGLFEMADKGTLFLDEFGEMSLGLQAKLLRVLQDGGIRRVGGAQIIPVNVRIIVATNANLEDMVEQRLLRADLYYRINVLSLTIPPLRERPQDISLLIRHFVQKYAKEFQRRIILDKACFDALHHHSWPGNVRELENVVERAVLLTRGNVLQLSLPDIAPLMPSTPPVATEVAQDGEDEYQLIMRVLKETNGVVAGPKGAAQRLGLKRTTLLSRMKRLGIDKDALV